jgi:hypothetical protein
VRQAAAYLQTRPRPSPSEVSLRILSVSRTNCDTCGRIRAKTPQRTSRPLELAAARRPKEKSEKAAERANMIKCASSLQQLCAEEECSHLIKHQLIANCTYGPIPFLFVCSANDTRRLKTKGKFQTSQHFSTIF